MKRFGVMPKLRCATYFVLPSLIALALTASPFAKAQAQLSSNEFASSAVAPPDSDAALTPAAPAMGGGGERSDRSYGYHDHQWSSHLTFEAGGGFNAPIGNDQPVITWGGNFTGGVGYRFEKHLSVLAEYQFMDNKLPGGLIADAGAQGGHAHIWSLTLDPVIDLFPARKNDVYVTGGGGFYRKVTSFTDPEELEECYYFCTVYTENVVVSHFSSNQGGLNFGVGFTHKLGSDEHLKAFAEARYLWLNTPPVGTYDGLGRTELIPVTFGVRF